ncbi:MAG: hypothetical protein IT245_04115 [Bacteroidia bacterium]|nr:hypothetical protein [Bacteroidia bacterium]
MGALYDQLLFEFEKSVSNYNGFSIERARKRDDLQNKSLVISNALVNLRTSMKYKLIDQLTSFVNLDFVELSILNEEELINYASNMYDLYLICEARLKIQGLKQKDVDAFVSSLTLCALDYPMNKFHIELRKQASLLSMKAYADLNDFFISKLDVSMEAIGVNYPELLFEYNELKDIKPFDFNQVPDAEGSINDGEVHIIKHLAYDRDREFRMVVNGGNAIWGLSNKKDKIENCRPININDRVNILSRWIGDSGNYLMIQSVNASQPISYKVWITES